MNSVLVRNRASSPCRSVRLAAIWTAIEVPIVAPPAVPARCPISRVL